MGGEEGQAAQGSQEGARRGAGKVFTRHGISDSKREETGVRGTSATVQVRESKADPWSRVAARRAQGPDAERWRVVGEPSG